MTVPNQTDCIYPGPHLPEMSKEHFLPAALGSFMNCEPLLDRLCRRCNETLGNELDVQLTRAGFVGLMRWLLGVHGRNGLPPSPFFQGAGKAPAIRAYGRLDGFDFPITLECRPGTQDVVPMRQIVIEHKLLGTQSFPIFNGMTPDRFIELLRAEGWHTGRPVYAFADPSEFAWIEELARTLGGQPDPSWKPVHLPAQPVQVVANLTITPRSFRGIAKISFHYLLKMCPEFDGKEREFDQIRDYIWTGNGRQRVHEVDFQVFANFLHGQRPSVWSHFLYIVRERGHVWGYVQLFIGPHALFRPYQIDIGRDPAWIRSAPRRYGHQFAMTNPSASAGFIGEMVDILPVQHVTPVIFT